MTTINESKLRELARKATPGPWRGDSGDVWSLTDCGQGYPLDRYPDSIDVAVGQCERCGSLDVGITRDEDREFIAAASPDVVLALLDALTSAREDARRARMVASDAGMEELAKLTRERDEARRCIGHFVETIEAARRQWDSMNKGGQHLPATNEFAHVQPSVKSRLEWWARLLKQGAEFDGGGQ